jgi:hypothetical protein
MTIALVLLARLAARLRPAMTGFCWQSRESRASNDCDGLGALAQHLEGSNPGLTGELSQPLIGRRTAAEGPCYPSSVTDTPNAGASTLGSKSTISVTLPASIRSSSSAVKRYTGSPGARR